MIGSPSANRLASSQKSEVGQDCLAADAPWFADKAPGKLKANGADWGRGATHHTGEIIQSATNPDHDANTGRFQGSTIPLDPFQLSRDTIGNGDGHRLTGANPIDSLVIIECGRLASGPGTANWR